MKKAFLIFTVMAGFLCGCTNKQEIALSVADSFLKSYYCLDYHSAESFCTPELAAKIEEAVRDIDDLPEYVRKKMKEASEETSYEIIAVDAESVKGEAAVLYRLFASGLDKPLEKRLRLKIERDSALVYAVE